MAYVVFRGGAGFVPSLRIRPSKALFYRILSIGLVACALASVANLTTILVTAQLRHYGTTTVAAYGISARLEFLMIPLAFGVGSALTALVGRAVGAGDWHTARRTAWVGALLALLIAGTVGAAVGLAPNQFAGLFTQDPNVGAIAARALSWVGRRSAASAWGWRSTSRRWVQAVCAGRSPRACAVSPWRRAVAGCWPTSPGWA
jgi:Na+-driven multidrug efflux pump